MEYGTNNYVSLDHTTLIGLRVFVFVCCSSLECAIHPREGLSHFHTLIYILLLYILLYILISRQMDYNQHCALF